MKALLLCAGAGSRMRPRTLTTPKPLVEVAGVPMVVRQIESLKKAGITDFVINAAHLSKILVQELSNRKDLGVNITFSIEGQTVDEALETRGGIVKAMELLTDGVDPFIVVASDIVTDYPYERLVALKNKLSDLRLAHLVFVKNPSYHPFGDMALSNGVVSFEGEKLTFASLGIYNPKLFKGLSSEKAPLFPWLYEFVKEGLITGEYWDGLWFNVGDERELSLAQKELANA